MNARNEKETGIEFVLNDENSYGDFVSVLNDFAIAQHERYGIDLDKTGHLFAVTDDKDPWIQQKIFDYGTSDMIGYKNERYYYEGFQKFQYQLSKLPIKAFYLAFSFLILLQISVLSLVRKSVL